MLPIETMLAAFQEAFQRRVPFREDGLLGPGLMHEVRPILYCLVDAARAEPSTACNEAYGLVSLLGRRAGALGITPTAALAIREALLAALRETGIEAPARLSDELTMVLMEGYCAGRDERTTEQLRDGVARGQLAFWLAPRCRCVFLTGPLDLEALQGMLEKQARLLMSGNAASCLLDTTQLEAAPPEGVARALLEFTLSGHMLGVRMVMVCSDPEWRTALGVLHFAASGGILREHLEEALPEVLRFAGHELKPFTRKFWASTRD